jgi:hypothetical protein
MSVIRFAVAGAAVAATALGRARLLRWGATADDHRGALPGDDLVAEADLVATRAITIDCAPDAAWPWVAQLGQGRGGFYSYDRLENLLGCKIHSADRIIPDWQHIAVGDEVHLAPELALLVAVANPPRELVLRGMVGAGPAAPPFDFSWAFVLREGNDGMARLIVRERYHYLRRWTPLMVEPVAVISFVMSQKMLRGIKERAEANPAGSLGVSVD